MKTKAISNLLLGAIVLLDVACSSSSDNHELQLHLSNVATTPFVGVVEVPAGQLSGFSATQAVIATAGSQQLATQWNDSNGDGQFDALCVNVSLQSADELIVSLIAAGENDNEDVCQKQTQAELWHKTTGKFKDGKYIGGGNFSKFDSLRVPDGFTDHAYYIKYEGPGWESDKVGYRLYLDWRNAIDVFGKRVSTPVLQNVGLDGYESYHHLQDWGMDVLKVGNSLGLGSTAWWNGQKAIRVEKTDSVSCRILADGTIRSQVQIWYNGWQLGTDTKVDLNSLKTIDAGSRMTHEQLLFNAPVKNICTGIRKEPGTNTIHLMSEDKAWACLATWGKQSLNKDLLGLAIIYPKDQQPVLTEDADSHVVVFEKALEKVEYYFLAAWELEEGGLTTEQQFVDYLRAELNHLQHPIKVSVVESK
jgi:hypothetical protein